MKLYVGNLAFSVRDEALKKAFSEFGDIEEATVIIDRFSNRSKGFGFVTFKDAEAGKKALQEMDGKEIDGRPIKVSEAKPMAEYDRPRQNRSFSGGSRGPRREGGSQGGFRRDSGRDGGRRDSGRRDSGRSHGGSFRSR